MTRTYDSTVARIAGNILSGHQGPSSRVLSYTDAVAVQWAVAMARAIVAETQRTEPSKASGE